MRFLGGAAAPPLAAQLAIWFTPSVPYYVAGGSVLIAAIIVIAGVRFLGRVNNGPEPLLVEAESIGVGELA